jgi:hypothetical protein
MDLLIKQELTMKNKIATTILTAIASLAFADESSFTLPVEKKFSLDEKVAPSKSYTYLRMGVTDSYPVDSLEAIPNFGVGYRMSISENSAIDFSASYMRGTGLNTDATETAYYYTLPKVGYMHYYKDFYAEGGIAAAALKTTDGDKFQGLVPSLAIGYEINRGGKNNVRSFVQAEVSQPALAATRSGDFPGPLAEVSVGLGF